VALLRLKGRTTSHVLAEMGTLMFAAYLAVTLLASAVNGIAAVADLIGHEYPKTQADKLRIPRSWVRPLGALLAAGALGLLVGFAVPALGTLAAAGLVLYFLGAFGAHLRARDYQLGPWAIFFSVAVAALAVNLAYHGPW
jgi:DoxX-like family